MEIGFEQKRPINDDYKGGRIFIGGLCVSRMSLITTCIGVCSCRIILIIMISAMVLTRISAEEESVRKMQSFLSSFEGHSIRHYKNRNGKETHKNWDMEPMILKLGSVLNEFKRKEVKEIYKSAEPCMPDKCGKSQRCEFKIPKRFKCAKFKRSEILKKILKILSKFHLGIQCFFSSFKSYGELISLQDNDSERRIKILHKFKKHFEMLMVEVESLLTKKRLKAARNRMMATVTSPSTNAHLINELMVIQDSEKFLIAWKKTLNEAFACWNKRKRHRRPLLNLWDAQV